MKPIQNTLSMLILVGSLLAMSAIANAQNRPLQRNPALARYSFQVMWSELLPPDTKLIDSGRVKYNDDEYLVTISASRNPRDTQRTLSFLLWSGSRFVSEGSYTIKAAATDALLVGQFRNYLPVANPTAPQEVAKPETKKKGKGDASRTRNVQIVTSESVFEWNGKDFDRISVSPVGVKLGVSRGRESGLMVAGVGDFSSPYAFEGKILKQVPEFTPPSESETYAFYGCGTQTYTGSEKLRIGGGASYVQSYWKNQNFWMIGYAPGKITPLPDNPKATSGDSVVLLMPRQANNAKSFWATSPNDMEEVWRSDGFPGRILDVRVGDPKNEGTEGIMVLVAINEEKDRRLYFIRKVDLLNPRRS